MNSKAKLGLYMICQIHIKSPSLLKLLLSISLFSMILIASSGFFPAMTLHNAKAQQPAAFSSNFSSNPSLNETNPNAITITVNNAEEVISESYNTISNGSEGNLSAVLLNQIVKPTVLESMGNKSRGGVSIVVGVITPNGTSVSGYGNISKADSTKVNGDTIFEIGSFTKTFTAALLADMVKRGIVNLDDPIEKYLPSNNVTVPSYNGHKITLENLATHTSGLPDIAPALLDNRTYSTQQAYNFISNSSFVSEPGTRYNYSNLGVGLLGHALTLKAGMPYEQLVRDRILNVLGMNSTGIIMNSTQITTPHPDLLKSKAKGHMGGKEISFSLIPEIIQSTGAAYSSANDLLKYLSANMGLIDTKINDILQDTHLIRHPSTTAYFNQTALPSITHDLMDVYNGLVWEIYTNLGGKDTVVSKDGGVDGYSTFVMFNPTKQIGLVVLCSCDGPDINASLLGRLLYLWIRAVPVSDS